MGLFLKVVKETATPSAALIVLAVAFNFYLYARRELLDSNANFGGPAGFSQTALLAPNVFPEDFLGFVILDSSSALDPSNPLSGSLPDRGGLLIYKVKAGDTVSEVAANFGISAETIIGANPAVKPSALKPGQEIIILPVSGVLHRVREGDTLDVLTAAYNINPQEIVNFNKDFNKLLETPGSSVIIPGAKPAVSRLAAFKEKLPALSNYFAIPTTGWNWGQLHDYNAVDIANACGTPIYAAAEGLVMDERSEGWNYGFGRYIKIEHPNKTETLYAHTKSNKVKVGDYILQGDIIGYIGNTGNTHGPTGCHLHFEIHGAKNPFVKY